jgi:hypothetical protein
MDIHLRFSTFKDYRPTFTNFKPLYSNLLVYKQNFQKLYDFFADGIKSEYIPRADNKGGGLIKIFIDKIPMGIGRRMYHNLNRERFTDMDEFIKAFYSQLQVLHEVSVEVTKLSSVIYEATSTPQQEKTISRTLNLRNLQIFLHSFSGILRVLWEHREQRRRIRSRVSAWQLRVPVSGRIAATVMSLLFSVHIFLRLYPRL